MNIILFDQKKYRNNLKPLTLTQPISLLRVGIKTISEKYHDLIDCQVSFLTESYLSKKFPANYQDQNIYVNASVLPNEWFIEAVQKMENDSVLKLGSETLAIKTESKLSFDFGFTSYLEHEFDNCLALIKDLPDLFLLNASEIEIDFLRIIKKRKSEKITDEFTKIYNVSNVFVEEGADIKAAILNAEKGSIYIGKNAIIQEGSIIIGPAAICEDSMVAFGAKIRPNVTIGPVSRVGGEVGNCIFQSYSNKAHDGFLGNSYIGSWCNLGANTNNSNLKNDYKTVKLYNYGEDDLVDSENLFCGLFMADYSKAGISTMFNTGTVVGVCSNVFGSGFQEKHIPSFSWGGAAEGYSNYRFEKAIEVIKATMDRRDKELTFEEIAILKYISDNQL